MNLSEFLLTKEKIRKKGKKLSKTKKRKQLTIKEEKFLGKTKLENMKLHQKGYSESDYFQAYDNGTFKAIMIRAGSEYGDPSREGTWYEIYKFDGMRSSYKGVGGGIGHVVGVGGQDLHIKAIKLFNPYYFDSKKGEGFFTLELAEEVLGKVEAKRLSKGIRGFSSEKAFAKLEKAISRKLKANGYDSVIFYDFLRNEVFPSQVFVLANTKIEEKDVSEHFEVDEWSRINIK